MASATLVAGSIVKDAANLYGSAVVAEGAPRGNVEYTASTPLLDAAGNPKSAAQLKADLVAALKAARDAQIALPTAVGGITGAITL